MDKVKTNFAVIIAVLLILCVVVIGYAANLNTQLGAEKAKVEDLNNQLAGLNTKAGDLQIQLSSLTAQIGEQANLIISLQDSLNTANAELEKLKTTQPNLETESKVQAPANQ